MKKIIKKISPTLSNALIAWLILDRINAENWLWGIVTVIFSVCLIIKIQDIWGNK